VIEIKEHVIGMLEFIPCGFKLVELERNIGDLIKVSGPDLTDMEINEVSVVGIYFK
jgi:hypothetical protein